jgi:hypothetical protein
VAPVAVELAGRLSGGSPEPLVTADLTLVLETATRALQQGRAGEVLAALDRLWSDSLASDSPWYLRAAALEVLGRSADAEMVLRSAIAKLPRSAALLYLLGVHASARLQPDAALVASSHALRVHPDEPLLLVQHAALMRARDDSAAADTLLQRARSTAPQLPVDQWMQALSSLCGPTAHTARARTPSLTPVHVPALDATRDGSVDIADDPEAKSLLSRTVQLETSARALAPRVMAAPCTAEALTLLRTAVSLARSGRSAELHTLLSRLADAGDAVMRERGAQPGTRLPQTPTHLRRITPVHVAQITPPHPHRVTPSATSRLTPSGSNAPGTASADVDVAVRFGLALLDPPADAALRATRGRVRATPIATNFVPGMFGTTPPAVAPPAAVATLLAWPALVLAGGVILAAVVPPLRVPGVVLAVAGLVMLARRSR